MDLATFWVTFLQTHLVALSQKLLETPVFAVRGK
jgi:hypothetical protein